MRHALPAPDRGHVAERQSGCRGEVPERYTLDGREDLVAEPFQYRPAWSLARSIRRASRFRRRIVLERRSMALPRVTGRPPPLAAWRARGGAGGGQVWLLYGLRA